MKAWQIMAFTFIGISIVEYLIILTLKKEIGDSINIKKQVMKNRKSPNNTQEYQATQKHDNKNKGLFKRLKNRKNGKS